MPASALVGPEDRGWYHIATSLDFERSGVAAFARGQRHVEQLVGIAKQQPAHAERNEQIRYELADRWIELEVGFQIAERIPWLQTQGISPNHEASISKLYGSEMTQRIAGTGVKLLGLTGLVGAAAGKATGGPGGSAFARAYLRSVGSTIAGGTSEIQRNIIAQRGLGLPR